MASRLGGELQATHQSGAPQTSSRCCIARAGSGWPPVPSLRRVSPNRRTTHHAAAASPGRCTTYSLSTGMSALSALRSLRTSSWRRRQQLYRYRAVTVASQPLSHCADWSQPLCHRAEGRVERPHSITAECSSRGGLIEGVSIWRSLTSSRDRGQGRYVGQPPILQ